MELSYRMMQIAECVSEGNRLADVGTDHGFIPIYLILHNRIPSAIAMDINEGPLNRAKEHIIQYHLEDKISCRLSDGLEKIETDETDTVVIAGMGGHLISSILENGKEKFLGNKELILQPQSEYYKVRKKIHELQYKIVEERCFVDEGKYYVVIKAQPGIEKYDKEEYYIYGKYLLLHKDVVLKEYLLQRIEKYNQIILQLQDNQKRYNEIKKEISFMELVLENYLMK